MLSKSASFSTLARRYSLKLLIVFGSYATGKMHRGSDVDVAVFPTKKLSLTRELKLRRDLFKHFKREIDLVILPQALPLLLKEIATTGRCLVGSRADFITFQVQAMKQFLDFKPYFELQEKTVRRRIKALKGGLR